MMKVAIAAVSLTILSACASTGLGVSRDAMPTSLQPIYDRASIGDKRAQFELGLAYASGAGVARDCDQARRLLKLAAADTGGTLWVYSPPVGNGTQGRVIPIDQGPRQPGLRGASELLADDNFCPL